VRRPKLSIPYEWKSRSFWLESCQAYLYLLPAVAILAVFTFYPFFYAFRLSLFKWSVVHPPGEYVGLANFSKIFADRWFWNAVKNTFIYVGTSVPITLFLALLVANLLNKPLRGRTFARTSFFLAYITPLVAVAMVWSWMYNWHFGLFNYILGLFGVKLINWLMDPKLSLLAVIILSVWRFVGYQAIILLAGLQNIDKMYYDAAKVDGATGFRVWWHVTIPLLTPQIFFVFIMSMIGSFKVFTEIYVLFSGTPGPLKSAETLVYYILRKGRFDGTQLGIAAAASVFLFVVIFAFTVVQLLVTQRKVHYQ
jgi:multiple sugar transport system permease protein